MRTTIGRKNDATLCRVANGCFSVVPSSITVVVPCWCGRHLPQKIRTRLHAHTHTHTHTIPFRCVDFRSAAVRRPSGVDAKLWFGGRFRRIDGRLWFGVPELMLCYALLRWSPSTVWPSRVDATLRFGDSALSSAVVFSGSICPN